MECSRCKHEISYEEYRSIAKNCTNINIPKIFSPDVVLQKHQTIHEGIAFLLKNKTKFNFYDKCHHRKQRANRPVLIRSLLTSFIKHEEHCDGCHRKDASLMEMKLDHVYQDYQLFLWVVTQAQPTSMIDGTTYLIVRDKSGCHIRLVINHWSYTMQTNEVKSIEALSRILDELLPVDSMIKLYDPLLTKCTLDDQLSLRCDAPNTELILSERIRKCFVLDKLDDLRDRGNQAYIRGDNQLALDYYTFAIQRIVAMAGVAIAKDNDAELDLFHNAFQNDLARLHSNRSACYLREHLYSGASLDSLVIVTGRCCNQTYDEFFVKCLYRLICSNIALEEFSCALDELMILSQHSSINANLRVKYSSDFNQIQMNLSRLKEEHQHGQYDLKRMLTNPSIDQTTFFDVQTFHCNFQKNSSLKKRPDRLLAKCVIPVGTLLLVQNAFAYVKSDDGGTSDQRRLLNEIEKRLVLAPTASEFELIRMIPCIHEWFENQEDADEDDYETYPKAFPWVLLVEAQHRNPFRSKSLMGWWPEASIVKVAVDSKQQANCLWFICGSTLFLFNFITIKKNDELIIATNDKISSFLEENQQQFVFLLDNKNPIRLDEIFEQLKQTQIYFNT